MSAGKRKYDRIENNLVYSCEENVLAVRRLSDVLDAYSKQEDKVKPTSSGLLPRGCRYYAVKEKSGMELFIIERPANWLTVRYSTEKFSSNKDRKVNRYKVFAPTFIFAIEILRNVKQVKSFTMFCSEHTMDRCGLNIHIRRTPLSNSSSDGTVCDASLYKELRLNARYEIGEIPGKFLSGVFNNDLNDCAYDFKQWEKESKENPNVWKKICEMMPYIPVKLDGVKKKYPALWQWIHQRGYGFPELQGPDKDNEVPKASTKKPFVRRATFDEEQPGGGPTPEVTVAQTATGGAERTPRAVDPIPAPVADDFDDDDEDW